MIVLLYYSYYQGRYGTTMIFSDPEKRGSERYSYLARIEFILETAPAQPRDAVTIDISSSGLGLYAFSPLEKGQQIILRGGLPVAHRRASVRWISQQHGDLYKVGVRFSSGSFEPGSGSPSA